MASYKKGEALLQIGLLQGRIKNIPNEINTLETSLNEIKKINFSIIDQLKSKADELAQEFRRLYNESRQAYDEDDKALAKQLSLEGKAAQADCEVINADVKRLFEEISKKEQQIGKLKLELVNLPKQISQVQADIQRISRPQLLGFEKAKIKDLDLEQFLDNLPQAPLKEIQQIEFVPETPSGKYLGGKLGDTRWYKKTHRASIRIFHHEEKYKGREKETIAHEIGHEIAVKYLTKPEERAWEESYLNSGDWFITERAMSSAEEDFCECFGLFLSNPVKKSELAKERPDKYTLIERIINRLENLQ